MILTLLAALATLGATLTGAFLLIAGLSSDAGRDGGRALATLMVAPPFLVCVLVAHAVGGHLTLTNDGGQHAAVSAVGPASGKPLRTGALGWILPGATIAQPDAVTAGQALTVDVNGQPQALTVQ